TLQHIRSLGSGVFSHAVNVGVIESNPWHDVKILGKTKAPGKTKHYTLEEAVSAINALKDHVDCQLVMALAFFLGLRPGEIEGLRWEDFTRETSDNCEMCKEEKWEMPLPHVHIRRAIARSVIGETKTKDSVAPLPLVAPILKPLQTWWRQSGNP